jgi:transcriptional regulator with XRE-family HTH domain
MNSREIGQSISARRKTLGLDQKSLADIAGISVHALSDVETGKGNPTVRTLNALADCLGMELQLVVRRPAGEQRDGQ